MTTSTPGTYSFLPWVRRGASTAVTQSEDVTNDLQTLRPTFDLSVETNRGNAQPLTVEIYGPGDLTGIDQQQIVRTDPKRNAPDFEPNYLAAIEFDFPDFVWMMTPANPKAGTKLRPWICLVVVPKDTVGKIKTGTPPLLEVANAGMELPDLSESWAWAHAQVSGDLTNGPGLDEVLEKYPERTVSRLVCPRRLTPNVTYLAAVVPTTKAGAAAGRGDPVDLNDRAPAWTSADNQVTLPVYYSWEFTTGANGDFESLARLLRPGTPPTGTGQTEMDIGQADPRLPHIPAGDPGVTLGFEGALVTPGMTPTAWPAAAQDQYQIALTAILNEPADHAGTVGPPLYGGFHAAKERVPDVRPVWFRKLNLDPRYRAAAGLGTRVVQQEQEHLMEAAWAQAEEIEKANEALRKAQLARAALLEIHQRDLTPLEAGALLQVTSPTHGRVRMSPQTLARQVRGSRLPPTALSPPFRRITRPRGAYIGRSDPQRARTIGSFVARLNSGEISAASPRHDPDGTVAIDAVIDAMFPAWLPRWLRPVARYLLIILLAAAVVTAIAAALLSPLAAWLFVVAGALVLLAFAVRAALSRWLLARSAMTSNLTPTAVARATPQPKFSPIPLGTRSIPPPAATQTGAPDNDAAIRFRAAATAKQKILTEIATTPAPEPGPPLELAAVRETLLARLDPRKTVPPIVVSRISFPDGWAPTDPIDTIMVAPEFTTPMYLPLRDIAKEALLPGVEGIKPNTVTFLETNSRFIESFMVGANYEMGRELLWREFPTDQRGTYFRYFWDQRGRVPEPANDAGREIRKDIMPIHTWGLDAQLGAAGGPASRTVLVLLVRARLIERYGNLLIYATKANSRPNTPGRKPLDPPEEKQPIFRGSFPPDITFLGFDLTVEQARGGPAPVGDAADPGTGWFFVLQEHSTEPRFGSDEDAGGGAPPTKWADLSWNDIALKNDYIDVAGTRTKLTQENSPLASAWAEHAAALAVQMLQNPFRVAISADDMLP